VAQVHFETLPAAEIDALQLAEFADVPANSQASDADLESEDPPARLGESDQAILDRSADPRRSRVLASSRLLRDAPLIVSLLLGVLITVELAHASLVLLSGGPSRTQDPPHQVPGARAPQRQAFDVNSIVAAHLFGEAALPGTKDPAIAQPTTANLLLAGTLAMEDPKLGLAIITNDGRSKAYRVGDTVADGELHSVFRDHVLLRRRGLLETLVFPRLRLTKESTRDSNRQPAPAAARDDSSVAHHSSAGDLFRGMSSLAPGGKLRGFRIFPSGDPKQFEKSGLDSGDLVVAINGVSLENQDRKTGEEMFNSMKTSSQATMTVVHNGVRHDVTVNSPSSGDSADSADEPDAADQ